MATYVSLVNNAIDESGADLALYAENGSDFTTNTEPMLNRFKTWVARAWKTVQQVAFDWEFLNNQAIVTVQPGLMFYSAHELDTGTLPSVIDIYGVDNIVVKADVNVLGYRDLTYTQYSDTDNGSFAYLDLATYSPNSISDYKFKAGGDYFHIYTDVYTFTVAPPYEAKFFEQHISQGDLVYVALISSQTYNGIPEASYFSPFPTKLDTLTPNSNDSSRGSTSFVFKTGDSTLFDMAQSLNFTLYVYKDTSLWTDITQGQVFSGATEVDGFAAAAYDSAVSQVQDTFQSDKAYLHSWKSFLFSEENDSNDYVGELSEIDNNSFHLIDHEASSPSTTRPLTFVPWHIFSVQYDNLTTPPSTPRYITEDNTGRWRLYPHPDRPVTLKFSYSRTPQNLVEWDDEPKGLPADFTDLVMWLAVRMYGEFDEQPSVARRAERYYKDLLQRLQIKYRPKFHIKPKRLY